MRTIFSVHRIAFLGMIGSLISGCADVSQGVDMDDPQGMGAEEEVASASEAIVNGTPVATSDRYWRATVSVNNNCTGTIIGTRYVLTAAHCNAQAGGNVYFYTGSTQNGQSRAIRSVTYFPGINGSNCQSNYSDGCKIDGSWRDLVVVELDHRIPDGYEIAKLAPYEIANGSSVVAVGLGDHDGVANSTNELRKRQVNTQTNHDHDRIFTPDSTVNPGDSGGPLFTTEGDLVVHGALSGHGHHDAGVDWFKTYSLYTSVARLREFILGNTPFYPIYQKMNGTSLPANAVKAGWESNGVSLYLCTATYGGGLHPGKYLPSDGKCHIGWGGKEVLLTPAAIGVGIQEKWLSVNSNSIVFGILSPGTENGNSLGVCRFSYNGGMHPGRRVGANCNIGWGGQEISATQYEVLQVAGPAFPAAQPPSEWNLSANWYNTNDGCDCNAAIWDPDCDKSGQSLYGCGSTANGCYLASLFVGTPNQTFAPACSYPAVIW